MGQNEQDEFDTLEEVHSAYQPAIYQYIRSQVVNNGAAEDLTIETFMAAYRSWKTFCARQPMEISDWLFAIARRILLQSAP